MRAVIEAAGAKLRYLPKYSPPQPDQQAFSKLKAHLQKQLINYPASFAIASSYPFTPKSPITSTSLPSTTSLQIRQLGECSPRSFALLRSGRRLVDQPPQGQAEEARFWRATRSLEPKMSEAEMRAASSFLRAS